MNKLEIQKRVLRFGEPLALDKFEWCRETKTFSTEAYNVILDFRGFEGVTFKTGGGCTFKTDDSCVFYTGHWCIFETRDMCVFKTGESCVFDTGSWGHFYTGDGGLFKTGGYCQFDTGDNCVFKTDEGCVFKTGEECVVVTRDICRAPALPKDQSIRLKGHDVKGYEVIKEEVKTILIGDREIEISKAEFESLKQQLIKE